MNVQEIETNSSNMLDALEAVAAEMRAEGNFEAASRLVQIAQDTDMVTLAKLAMTFKEAAKP